MTALGWIYVLGVWFAVVFGLAVLIGRKGDSAHRWMGRAYVCAMLVVNIAGLLALQSGEPTIFHALSLASLAAMGTGVVMIRRERSSSWPIATHGHIMAWSFAFLVAAALGQGAEALDWPVLPAVVGSLCFIGLWIHTSDIRRTARRLASIDG